jgi:hypothetical protein
MNKARLAVVVIGVLLPYAARLPRGAEWLQQYTDTGWGGFLLISGFNAIVWVIILLMSLLYRRPLSLLAPTLPAFAFLFWAHSGLNLAADAQSGIALIFIPIYALPIVIAAGLLGYLLDRILRRGHAAT